MPGAVFGRAEILVDATEEPGFDEHVRRIGKRAGGNAGKSTSVAFSEELDKGLKAGADKSFSSWRTRFQNGVRDLTRKIEPNLRGLRSEIDSFGPSLKSFGLNWRDLSANTRQWTAIVGFVIAAISELAGLAAAAGAGIAVLGGVIAGFGVGAAAAGLGLFKLMQPLKDVPKELQPAAKAFQGFRAELTKAADALTIAEFGGAAGGAGWKSLTATVDALIPSLKVLGGFVGKVFQNFASGIAPGTAAFKGLQGLIEKSGPIFEKLSGSIGKVGGALLVAFNNSTFQGAIQRTLGYIDSLSTKFADFLQGKGFDEWIRHGESVFGAFGRLLGATGTLLNNLVTDASIQNLTNFIDHITSFMQTGGSGILQFANNLNVFGLLSQALDAVGKALEPLAGPMAALASAINAVISAGIKELAPILGDIAKAAAPFVQALADFMAQHPKEIADGLLAIAGAWVIMKGVGGILGLADRLTLFIGKMDEMKKKTPGWKTAVGGLAGGFAGVLATLPSVSDGKVSGDDVVQGLAGGILAGAVVGGPIGAAIGALGSLITSMLADMLGKQKGPWANGWNQIFDPSNFSGAGIGGFKFWLNGVVNGWMLTLIDWRDNWLPAWWQKVQAWWGSLSGSGEGSWLDNIVTGWQATLTGWANVDLPNWWAGVIAGWNGFWGGVAAAGANGWAQIQAGWNGFWGGFQAAATNGWAQIVAGWNGFWGTLVAAGVNGWGQIQGGWNAFWGGLPAAARNGWSQIVAGWNGFWAGLWAAATNGWGQITAWWNSIWAGFAAPVQGAWNAVTTAVRNAVGTISGIINGLAGPIGNAIRLFQNLFGAANSAGSAAKSAGGGGGGFRVMAAGGVLNGPRHILAGEAGPEAIVPLRRNLNQVDPAVRWLSAIAQGKTPMFGSGGLVGAQGKTIMLSDGAIQIMGSLDPRRTAIETVDRIVEVANS